MPPCQWHLWTHLSHPLLCYIWQIFAFASVTHENLDGLCELWDWNLNVCFFSPLKNTNRIMDSSKPRSHLQCVLDDLRSAQILRTSGITTAHNWCTSQVSFLYSAAHCVQLQWFFWSSHVLMWLYQHMTVSHAVSSEAQKWSTFSWGLLPYSLQTDISPDYLNVFKVGERNMLIVIALLNVICLFAWQFSRDF